MSQGPLCPNLSQKVHAEVSQMANHNLSRVILSGGLSVNLNHLKSEYINITTHMDGWNKPLSTKSINVNMLVLNSVVQISPILPFYHLQGSHFFYPIKFPDFSLIS